MTTTIHIPCNLTVGTYDIAFIIDATANAENTTLDSVRVGYIFFINTKILSNLSKYQSFERIYRFLFGNKRMPPMAFEYSSTIAAI